MTGRYGREQEGLVLEGCGVGEYEGTPIAALQMTGVTTWTR